MKKRPIRYDDCAQCGDRIEEINLRVRDGSKFCAACAPSLWWNEPQARISGVTAT